MTSADVDTERSGRRQSMFGVGLLLCHVSESHEKIDDDQDDDEVGFERTPKPMLPYSSLFIFGPTNP